MTTYSGTRTLRPARYPPKTPPGWTAACGSRAGGPDRPPSACYTPLTQDSGQPAVRQATIEPSRVGAARHPHPGGAMCRTVRPARLLSWLAVAVAALAAAPAVPVAARPGGDEPPAAPPLGPPGTVEVRFTDNS